MTGDPPGADVEGSGAVVAPVALAVQVMALGGLIVYGTAALFTPTGPEWSIVGGLLLFGGLIRPKTFVEMARKAVDAVGE